MAEGLPNHFLETIIHNPVHLRNDIASALHHYIPTYLELTFVLHGSICCEVRYEY